MALLLSPLAVQDIESIGDYIASDNPGRAVSFVKELYLQCQQIGEAPILYRLRPELGKNIRYCPYGRYLIFFSVQNNNVRVQRVLHGARDITQLPLE